MRIFYNPDCPYMKIRCAYCKWERGNLSPISECANENSFWFGDECVEQDRMEPRECDYKVILNDRSPKKEKEEAFAFSVFNDTTVR